MSRPPVSRRFTAVLGFSFAVEGALYSAVTPILPLLTHRFALSDSAAGLLLSSYSAGLVAGSLLCVLILARVNERDVAVGGLVVLAISTAAFAWAGTSAVLIPARLGQGIAAGVMWTACISWLLAVWPIERRGEALGISSAPAVIGTIAGPLIGTLALQLGIRGPYTVIAVACVCAGLWLLRMPRPARGSTLHEEHAKRASKERATASVAAGVAALAGAVIGLVNLSSPLVLSHLGAPDYASGFVFLAAAIVTVGAARSMGLMVDRLGARRAVLGGLLGLAVLLPVLGGAISVVLTAVVVAALVVVNNFCYISAGTMLTRAGQAAGWSLRFATALTATVWGLGETFGALAGGVGLDTAGSLWSSSVASAAVLVALVVVAALPSALGVATIGHGTEPSSDNRKSHQPEERHSL